MNYKNEFTVIAILLILIFGAVGILYNARLEKSGVAVKSSGGQSYRVVNVEGCEYFACQTSDAYTVLSHKGNCTNSIHWR